MKKLYFDMDNGGVVRPRDITAPEYYVVLDDKNNVAELYTCFSKANIETRGDYWRIAMLDEDSNRWLNWPWLVEELRRYISLYDHLSEKQNYEEEYKDDYVYLRFWKRQ